MKTVVSKMEAFTPTKSSWVKSLNYSKDTQRMVLETKNGQFYEIEGVTHNRWTAIKKAKSVGSAVAKLINQ
jgi:hypothetical protein